MDPIRRDVPSYLYLHFIPNKWFETNNKQTQKISFDESRGLQKKTLVRVFKLEIQAGVALVSELS